MITTYLQGGLGNYMFQIAAAHSLSLELGTTTLFSETNSTTVHRPLSTYKNNIFRKINFTYNDVEHPTVHQEVGFGYGHIPRVNDMMLSGYFQTEKYFTNNCEEVRELFGPTTEQINYIGNKYGDLSNTCSIHVRRGDYITQPGNHPPCSPQYYQEAMVKMPEGTKFLIFSDDIPFCKEVFTGESFIFVENEVDYIDMYIMSLCTNNIIANSTFSWWGAWLNKNGNKVVIVPSVWFGVDKQLDTKDIIPSEWVKI
tara:strand:- start:350 stop:1114 length:765 start_codon:yes stop_codon:yes gene_type:complete